MHFWTLLKLNLLSWVRFVAWSTSCQLFWIHFVAVQVQNKTSCRTHLVCQQFLLLLIRSVSLGWLYQFMVIFLMWPSALQTHRMPPISQRGGTETTVERKGATSITLPPGFYSHAAAAIKIETSMRQLTLSCSDGNNIDTVDLFFFCFVFVNCVF